MALVPFPGSKLGTSLYDSPDDDPDLELEEGADGKMSFLEHLDELRKRLMWAIAALFGGFLVALFFIDRIFGFIMRPLAATLPEGRKMIYTEPTEAFLLQLKVAALAGVVISAPAVMWQLWLFIAPGLYRREKRLALPFIVSTSLLFVAGAAFNHYVVFPIAFTFLGSFTKDYMEFMPRITPVFSLYSQLLLAFGIIFQMPVLVFTLARLGLVTAGFLWKNTKYAVLIIFVISAVITPTSDVVTQTLMAAPMLVLYVVSIGIAWVFGKKQLQERFD
ncbi:MAG TPA: twin-arginine translocase subunit TatC [Vicinamibacterales bacterium]|jgi:sec-independent protein translocase protein TatC|nr:twin-arginine translocase subunit TatC [Vicinamibacterales bacterium]